MVATLQITTLQCEFLGQILQVSGRTPVILGDDLVTGAVVTDGVTERNVEVQ